MELDLCLGLPNQMNLIGHGKSDAARCGRQNQQFQNFGSEFESVNRQFLCKQEPCETFEADTLPLFAKIILSAVSLNEFCRRQREGRPPLKLQKSEPQSASSDSDDLSVTTRREKSSYVKVNLEGVAIGRKIDLDVHEGYGTLLQTLQFMFEKDLENTYYQEGHGYTLIYEDQDGDWMLVGDVPWQSFVRSVKRLKIRRNNRL